MSSTCYKRLGHDIGRCCSHLLQRRGSGLCCDIAALHCCLCALFAFLASGQQKRCDHSSYEHNDANRNPHNGAGREPAPSPSSAAASVRGRGIGIVAGLGAGTLLIEFCALDRTGGVELNQVDALRLWTRRVAHALRLEVGGRTADCQTPRIGQTDRRRLQRRKFGIERLLQLVVLRRVQVALAQFAQLRRKFRRVIHVGVRHSESVAQRSQGIVQLRRLIRPHGHELATKIAACIGAEAAGLIHQPSHHALHALDIAGSLR